MRRTVFTLMLATFLTLFLVPQIASPQDIAACRKISPFCDKIYVTVLPGGRIVGYDDNCGGTCTWLVGGWKTGPAWALFLDFNMGAPCYAGYEYAIVLGSGTSGNMYRYDAAGNEFGPTAVTMVSCTSNLEGESLGPISME